jgi:cancer susceptibility candidate protein 1
MAKFLENMSYDDNINEDFEYDWKTVCWWSNKCTLIKARDHHASGNYEREDGILVS